MAARRDFVEEQLAALEPLDFVAFLVDGRDRLGFVEVHRTEDGESFHAHIGAQPPLPAQARQQLEQLGFGVEEGGPSVEVRDVTALADTVESVLADVLEAAPGTPLDVRHGSHRMEVEQQRKLKALRERLTKLLDNLLEAGAYEIDADGDFTFPFESTRVWVAPRALPIGGPLIVRVLAVTNVDIDPSPALGLFLSQTNFGLAFGRFSLDARHRAVWFEQNLLGEAFSDEEFGFLVHIVAQTADQYDDRIAEVFGGRVFNPPDRAAEAEETPREKPGTAPGGYL